MFLEMIMKDRSIARKLRSYRYHAGMSGDDAGRVIQKSASTIYKYESAKISISEEDMVALLLAYKVDLDEAFVKPLSRDDKSRRKNTDARCLREIENIWTTLDKHGKGHLMFVIKCIAAYYDNNPNS